MVQTTRHKKYEEILKGVKVSLLILFFGVKCPTIFHVQHKKIEL